MKIAITTNGIFPNVIGGIQKHSFYLIKYLAQRDVKIDLYHPNYDGKPLNFDNYTEGELRNIRIIEVPFQNKSKDVFWGHYIRQQYRLSSEIYKYLDLNVDLIYGKSYSIWRTIEEKKRNKSKKIPPIIIKSHGYECFQNPANFREWLVTFLFRRPIIYTNQNADYVFSYGGKISNIIRQRCGVPSERIIDISTGIDEKWLNNKESLSIGKPRRFIFLGRNERRKGIVELNQILPSILERFNIQFDFIGPIPPLILHPNVTYHGEIRDSNKISNLLRNCDVLLCPSHSEGMPNVILEGLASGCAVIATDIGTISTMVNQENGWLIEAQNKAVLKRTIEEAILLNNASLLSKKKKAIQTVEENFLWHTIADKTINAFKTILKID